MDKSDLFEFYEILALILPGSVFLYGVSKLFPSSMLFTFDNFSTGELGVFILLSYAAGHIVQVFGGFVEIAWRHMRGEPTEWIERKQIFSNHQIKALEERIPNYLGITREKFVIKELDRKEWLHMHKQMYLAVIASGDAKRLEKFTAIYNMCRGLVAALILLTVFSFFSFSPTHWYIPSLLLTLAFILFYRMARFERHAVHELFLQFLQLPNKKMTEG